MRYCGAIETHSRNFHRAASLSADSGSVYVLAVITLLVSFTLGLAMLRMIGADYREQDAQTRRLAARNLGEAGIDYAIWQILYRGVNIPYTANLSLNGGTVRIDATNDSSRAVGGVLITATGTYQGFNQTVKRSFVILPYMYAWCQNSSLSTDKPICSQQSPGGMRVNGNISLSKNTTTVSTGVWASGTISTLGTVPTRYPNSPLVKFPAIDYSYYRSLANTTYWGDRDFWNLYSQTPQVIFVEGNVDFNGGTYNGVFTIVATGNVEVKGNFTKANSSSYLAVVTTQSIEIEGSAYTVDAVLYSHKSDNKGLVHSLGSGRLLRGCIAGDIVDVDGAFTMERDMTITPRIMRVLHLPGMDE